jgi:hypothetical protein
MYRYIIFIILITVRRVGTVPYADAPRPAIKTSVRLSQSVRSSRPTDGASGTETTIQSRLSAAIAKCPLVELRSEHDPDVAAIKNSPFAEIAESIQRQQQDYKPSDGNFMKTITLARRHIIETTKNT